MAELNTRKRGDKWEYRFEAAKIGGKRKQISKGGFKTKKEALEAGAKALAEYNNSGQTFSPTDISVSDYLDYWFENVCKYNTKYNTQVGYSRIIKNHLKASLGSYRLTALSAAAIQEMVNQKKSSGLSRGSVKGIFSVLSEALTYATEPLHYIPYNPCNNVKIPKYQKKEVERYIITNEEFKQIIDRFPPGNNFYLPLVIGYHTGLRIGEVFGLTWQDIDFSNCTLSVKRILTTRLTAKDRQSSWYFGDPKTQSSTRTIKIGKTLCEILKAERKRQLANRMKYGNYYINTYLTSEKDKKGESIKRLIELENGMDCHLEKVEMVCVKENGNLVTINSFKYCSKIIHHELKLAFNFHSLRHTHATMLIENGANIKDVQTRLGHNNIQTTLQTYTHATEKMAEQTVDIFEKAINQKFVHQ